MGSLCTREIFQRKKIDDRPIHFEDGSQNIQKEKGHSKSNFQEKDFSSSNIQKEQKNQGMKNNKFQELQKQPREPDKFKEKSDFKIMDPLRNSSFFLQDNKKAGIDLARTWWFWTLDWPSASQDFNPDFEELSLRQVELERWGVEPDIDSEGMRKAFEIPFHRGVFQDFEGYIYDLKEREDDGCEIHQALMKKRIPELIRLYIEAISKELEDLEIKLEQIKKEGPKENNSNAQHSTSLLDTWWFCCPDWPPKNYDYKPKLEKKKWRVVKLDEWETEPPKDDNGYLKAFEIPLHPNVFQNTYGSQSVCKPYWNDASYDGLNSKSLHELLGLYVKTMRKNLTEFNTSYHQLLSKAMSVDFKPEDKYKEFGLGFEIGIGQG